MITTRSKRAMMAIKAPYGNEDLPAARLPARLRGFPSDQSDRGILGDIT